MVPEIAFMEGELLSEDEEPAQPGTPVAMLSDVRGYMICIPGQRGCRS
jgi:hypothetical protein